MAVTSSRRRMRKKITRPIAAGDITAPELSLPGRLFQVKPKHAVRRERECTLAALSYERHLPFYRCALLQQCAA
jgi:hypothetical protein